MGLDISAYSKLVKLDVLFDADGEPVDVTTRKTIENHLKVHVNHDFPGRAKGLKNNAVYSYDQYDHVFGRSYSGYSAWREQLAKLAGYPEVMYDRGYGVVQPSHAAAAWQGVVQAGAPFLELINFSDCEGVIGPVVAAKLLQDFITFDERARSHGDEWFYPGYCDIRRGLELAADGGALNFN